MLLIVAILFQNEIEELLFNRTPITLGILNTHHKEGFELRSEYHQLHSLSYLEIAIDINSPSTTFFDKIKN